MIWPLEPEGLRAFAAGRQELLFIEEKAAFLEPQAASILYNDATRPRIVGKRDPRGEVLLPEDVQLEPSDVAIAIAMRLKANGIWDDALEQRLQATRSYRSALLSIAGTGQRTPAVLLFGMSAQHVDQRARGQRCHFGDRLPRQGHVGQARNDASGSANGRRGLEWVGLAHFTKRRHVFQNLGDGTYFHSGLLAIRAAVASGVNITYKILFNDAVAMTGGQPVDGPITPVRIVHQVLHEGVQRIVLVTTTPRVTAPMPDFRLACASSIATAWTQCSASCETSKG